MGMEGEVSFTPFHIAAALPFKSKFDFWGFVWVNVLIDIESGLSILYGGVWPDSGAAMPLHGDWHTLAGATVIGLMVALFRWRLWGALIGAWSHVFIDMFCHHDVEPLAPWFPGNPFAGHISIQTVDLLLLLPIGWQSLKWSLTQLRNKGFL